MTRCRDPSDAEYLNLCHLCSRQWRSDEHAYVCKECADDMEAERRDEEGIARDNVHDDWWDADEA